MKKQTQKSTLTKRQNEVLKWIVDFIDVQGIAPTNQQIGDFFGITNGSVSRMVSVLCQSGHLNRDPKKRYSITKV